ncbi:MAG TPA: ABC transporter ATP-binding protein [Spirochaetia bacterium]|nr:ABC transporter ATP-binding protein [Spirochaetia bacterium]
MGALLSVEDVVVKYGNITALKHVSLSVPTGAIVCLIGANGAGKSTLLKAIVGLEPLSSGSIRYEDRVIAAAGGHADPQSSDSSSRAARRETLSTDKIVSLGISLVPEGRRVFADMTVEENLEMGGFREREPGAVARKIDEMYTTFPILKERRRQKTRSLSGGEQQMMSIARALMSSPRLLLLDEPGLGLAPLIIKHIFSIIKRINKEENVTVFLVEQNAKIALNTSDKGYVMETGNIVLEDASSSLLANDRVRAAYLGE